MATHDPVLALMGNRRIVIKNGGIRKIIETTDEEKEILTEIEELDRKVQTMREKLRNGEKLLIFLHFDIPGSIFSSEYYIYYTELTLSYK